MVQDLVKDIVLQHLGPLKRSRKNWNTRNCMLCHLSGESSDARGRFGILFSPDGKIAINCFNCNYDAVFVPGRQFSKKFEKFLLTIGVSQYDIKKLNFELFKEQNELEATTDIQLKGAITKKWEPRHLLRDSRPVIKWLEDGCDDPNFEKVLAYAWDRGFRNLDEVYWTPNKQAMYNKRLLLPFTYNGNNVGYTGRYYCDPPTKQIPKYHNNMPDNYIYNLTSQYKFDREYVILCEGVFDAYFMDGISTSHSTINEDQVQIINSIGKKVIVCPDMDKDGDYFVDTAVKNGWRVTFPDWGPGIKDAAQATEKFGRILTLNSIIIASERNPMTIQLKWKMNKNDRYSGIYKGN